MAGNKRIIAIAPATSMHSFRWCEQLEMAGFRVQHISLKRGSSGNENSRKCLIWPFISARSENPAAAALSKAWNYACLVVLILYTGLSGKTVNIHYLDGMSFKLARALAYAAPKRLFISCWGSDVNLHYNNSRGNRRRDYDFIYRRAALVSCDSEAVKDLIVKNVETSRVEILPWGTDGKRFPLTTEKSRAEAREFFGIPRDAVVFLSNRHPAKGYNLDKIVDWFEKLSEKMPTAYLLMHAVSLFSDGSYTERLEKAKRMPRVTVNESLLPITDLAKVYQAADFYLSYPDEDARPVSMIEALASGCMVFASPDIRAYRHLEERYALSLVGLKDVDEAAVVARWAERDKARLLNRRRFMDQDSLEVAAGNLARSLSSMGKA